eukprot:CAMPEP_0185034288 /NCGR_PEP_ID=MMETSP1103-20130426/24022_1 /TAXON_ID=36769 /ORGANISM="Paraphysomonas bandaiensis, Strain Caron Lab Isolate" /LENGTH=528 /DNA_ID=CAMNT_0027570887 /DNA_START=49 /DNA_END=1632 /DNA_ORIENTATION=-
MANISKSVAAELGTLEVDLVGNPDTFDKYGRLIELCVKTNAKPRAVQCILSAREFMSTHEMSREARFEYASALVTFWKSEKFSKKDSIRLNLTPEHKAYMTEADNLLGVLYDEVQVEGVPQELKYRVMLKLAYVKECLGCLSASLTILSDMITAEADDGVELAYIIFKAAAILKRLGQNGQALEYLEFVKDDPPQSEGLTRTHILSLLALTFEQSGSKYAVVLAQTYEDLKEAYLEDISKGPNPEATFNKVDRQLKQKPISESVEIWEVLSLQTLDRCELTLAAELFHQASLKAPNKPSLLHSNAELSYILGDRDRALKYAERAYSMQSQNGDLRNFLLLLDPEKWIGTLRTALPVSQATTINPEEEEKLLDAMGAGKSRLKKAGGEEKVTDEDKWLHSMKPVTKKSKSEEAKTTDTTDAKPTEKKLPDTKLDQSRNAVEKENEPNAEKKKTEETKKKKKSKAKEGKSKGKTKKSDEKKKKEEVVQRSDTKEERLKKLMELPIHNRPDRPEFLDEDSRKYIRFALCGN